MLYALPSEIRLLHAAELYFDTAIQVVSSGGVRLEPLLSHRFELAQAAEAVTMSGSPESLKVVIEL